MLTRSRSPATSGSASSRRVHDPEPQRRHVRQREHAEVAARQLRQLLEVPQRLVAPRRIRVVVGMALEVEQREVGHEVVRVPGMMRLRRLVLAIGQASPQEAVVLDVVRRRELPPGDEVVHQQERQHHPAEGSDQAELQHGADGVRLQHRVVRAPRRAAQGREPFALEAPCAADAAGQLAQGEPIDALAHARARMVFGCRHPAVVPATVLHREVPVRRHREHEPREPCLQPAALVAELVARVDAEARIGAGHIGEHQQRPPRQVVRADPPCAADQRDEVQRHRRPREPAVVAVLLELRHHRLGRVVRVLADQAVEQRHQAVADEQRQAERDLMSRRCMRRDAGERQQRIDDGQQPPPALAVAVFDGAVLGVDGAVDDAHSMCLRCRFLCAGALVVNGPAHSMGRTVDDARSLLRCVEQA